MARTELNTQPPLDLIHSVPTLGHSHHSSAPITGLDSRVADTALSNFLASQLDPAQAARSLDGISYTPQITPEMISQLSGNQLSQLRADEKAMDVKPILSQMESQLRVTEDAPVRKSIVLHALETLNRHVDHCQDRVRGYLAEMDERSGKIKFLKDFMQHLRSAGEPVDWENDVEKRALVEKAKAHGVVFPEGELKWNKDQKTSLLHNADSTIDPLLSENDKQKMMLGWYQNKESELNATISNILKRHHDDLMENLRKW